MQEINTPVLEILNTEKQQESKTYFDYYNRVIDNYKVGFKLVLGGTGLGKTYGIEKVLEHYTKVAPEKKFIYSTYRINLLTQFKEKQKDKCVHLEGNDDIVKKVAKEDIEKVKELLADSKVREVIHKLPSQPYKSMEKSILTALKSVKTLQNTKAEREVEEILAKEIEKHVGSFMRDMKEIVKNIAKNEKLFEEILKTHSVIKIIFPYIAFERDTEKQILLVTTDKLFYGFFDGKKTVNIAKIKDKIIFLDEFDFLEASILGQICKDVEIEDPFNFVRMFHNAMKLRLAKDDYLLQNDSQKNEQLREDVLNILDEIDTLRELDKPINYPNLYWFTCKDENIRDKKIFQSNYTTTANFSVFLQTTKPERAFELLSTKNTESLSAFQLLNVVNRCSKQIVRFFADLQGYSPIIYQEIIEQVYGKTEYLKILKSIKSSHSFLKKDVFLKKTNWEKIYDEGFRIFQFRNLQHQTENSETVEVASFGIQDTPESLLIALIKKNLVFGLSATADLNRVIDSFDMEWVRQKCEVLRLEKKEEQNMKKAFKELFDKHEDNERIKNIIKELLETALEDMPNKMLNAFTKECVQKYTIYHKKQKRELKSDEEIINSLEKLRKDAAKWDFEEVRPFYIDFVGEDKRDISLMNYHKWELRESEGKISFHTATAFDKPHNERFYKLLNMQFFTDDKYKDAFQYESFHQSRVYHFLGILDFIIQNPLPKESKEDTHLAFFSSFKQIKFFLELEKTSPQIYEHLQEYFRVNNNRECFYDNDEKERLYYEITYQERNFIVVLFDKELNKQLDKNPNDKQKYERLFWRELPVIVITQYQSASNGINLTYYPSEEAKLKETKEDKQEIDFRTIHLIDAPYYYFSKEELTDSYSQKMINMKKDIWKLAKLYYRKEGVSKEHFKLFLSNPKKLNDFYKDNAKDFLFNQMAKYIQTLGRIERVRRKMGHQRIRCSASVRQCFETFLTDDMYKEEREKRELYTSPLVNEVYECIKQQYKKKQKDVFYNKDEGLKAVNDRNREVLEKQFTDPENGLIALFRKDGKKKCEAPYLWSNPHNGKISSKMKAYLVNELWKKIRESALSLDVQCPVLNHFSCVFEDKNGYIKDDTIYINEELDYLPQSLGEGVYQKHNFNTCYAIISQNEIIQKYFNNKGYELSFKKHNNNKYFTPYFYQAFLLGALGEECTEAFLQAKGIKLVDDLALPYHYFEIIDKKIEDMPIFIDAKNFSDKTIQQLRLDDNDFKQKAQKKIQYLRKYERGAKLVYMMVKSYSESQGNIAYFDLNFEKADSFDTADIIIVQGIIDRNRPNEYCKGFETFISDIQHYKK